MFIDNHKETEIKLESYRLKLWYCYVVMIFFFSDVLILFISFKYKEWIKIEIYLSFKIDILHIIYLLSISTQDEV